MVARESLSERGRAVSKRCTRVAPGLPGVRLGAMIRTRMRAGDPGIGPARDGRCVVPRRGRHRATVTEGVGRRNVHLRAGAARIRPGQVLYRLVCTCTVPGAP